VRREGRVIASVEPYPHGPGLPLLQRSISNTHVRVQVGMSELPSQPSLRRRASLQEGTYNVGNAQEELLEVGQTILKNLKRNELEMPVRTRSDHVNRKRV
jgi:hypothetical protein